VARNVGGSPGDRGCSHSSSHSFKDSKLLSLPSQPP